MPGGREFIEKVHQHDNNIWLALTDVSFESYEKLNYTTNFIVEQFGSLYNMLRHNTWHPEESDPIPEKQKTVARPPLPAVSVLKSSKPVLSETNKAQNDSISSLSLNVEIPPLETDDPELKRMSDAIIKLTDALNSGNLSSFNLPSLKTLAYGLASLQDRLSSEKDKQSDAVKQAIDKKNKEFKEAIKEFEHSASRVLQLREAELLQAHELALSEQVKESQNHLLEELEAQKAMLERRFNRFVRARVDEERGGRLAQVDRLVAQYTELVALVREYTNSAESLVDLSRISATIDTLKETVMSVAQAIPFHDELNALIKLVQDISTKNSNSPYKATKVAMECIDPSLALSGVASQNELEDRFEYVRHEVRRVSLVPEDGKFASQVQSALLSKLMFEKQGLVQGNDTESILARAYYHLQHHNLDEATRELNQLKGWPRSLPPIGLLKPAVAWKLNKPSKFLALRISYPKLLEPKD